MGDVINLRQARKSKKRVEKEKRSEENRTKFGLSKIEKQLSNSEIKRNEKIVDQHFRESKISSEDDAME